MNRGDRIVERGADRLQRVADEARLQGGFKGKLGESLSEDAEFLRQLKPSLIRARAKGEAPTDLKPGQRTSAPSAPQLGPRPTPSSGSGEGPSPWLIVGIALALGIFLAKWLDWRGHAHPRL